MAAPTIVEVHPVSSATGVVLSDTITVTFDQEVDIDSVSIIVEGPDTDKWSGPDLALFDDLDTDSDDDILSTAGYKGIVQGEVTEIKVDAEGDTVSTYDYTGGGSNWYSKAVFTPDIPLASLTSYRVYVIGDESDNDNIMSGVSARTVFDTSKGTNLGTGDPTFGGMYTGTITDVYNARISSAGAVGTAKFVWWKDSDPLIVRELTTKQNSQLLSDGVSIQFTDSTYVVNDTFEVVVKAPVRMASTYTWTFTSGAGSIETVPSASVVSIPITSPEGSTGTDASTFTISSMDPDNRDTNLAYASLNTITVTFSADPDATTITDSTVTVSMEPVNGDPAVADTTELVKALSLSGSVLTITIDASTPLDANRMVIVTLDETIADDDGNTLVDSNEEAGYVFYFTTTYDPLYSQVRRIRLDLGSSISDIPDDTINLAIFEASLEANVLVFGTVIDNSEYFTFAKRQYVTCAAELILLQALSGGGTSNPSAKRLADLEVKWGTGTVSSSLTNNLQACKDKWKVVLNSSGAVTPESSIKPSMVIKGAYDPDRPNFGRTWDTYYDGSSEAEVPAANSKSKYTNTRRWKNGYLPRSRWGSRFSIPSNDDTDE